MKKIIDWLNEAKEQGYEWADAAIMNYYKQGSIGMEASNLVEALERAFLWDDTTEHGVFWGDIHTSLINDAYPYPPLPKPKSLVDLATRYESLNKKLEQLTPDPSLREPFRQEVYEATKASYKEEADELFESLMQVLTAPQMSAPKYEK